MRILKTAVSVILSILLIRSREQPFTMKWEYIRFSGNVVSFVMLVPGALMQSMASLTVSVMLQGLAQIFIVHLPVSYFMSIQPNASLTMIGLAAPCAAIFGTLSRLYRRIMLY